LLCPFINIKFVFIEHKENPNKKFKKKTKGVSKWNYADPICTFLFAFLVLYTTKGPVVGIMNSFMHGTPAHLDSNRIQADLEAVDNLVHRFCPFLRAKKS